MKKLLFIGIVTLVLALMVATTRVWSSYLPPLHLRGATLGSLSTDLLLSNKAQPTRQDYQAFGELHGAQNLIPGGQEVSESFWILNRNNSTPLRVLGRFVAGDGDWNALSPLIEVQVAIEGKQLNSPWIMLSHFAQFPEELTQNLGPTEEKKIVVRYRMIHRYAHDPDGTGPLQVGDLLGGEVQELISRGIGFELSATRLE